MKTKNLGFKVKVNSLKEYENLLVQLNPTKFGINHQIDTYFETIKGRLILRETTGKQTKLIDESNAMEIVLYEHNPSESLKSILSNQLEIKVIVNKKRKIYGIANVKFFFDIVENLGAFLEVQAIGENEDSTVEKLKKQCDYYYDYFNIHPGNVEELSYGDLLLRIKKNDEIRLYFANAFPVEDNT